MTGNYTALNEGPSRARLAVTRMFVMTRDALAASGYAVAGIVPHDSGEPILSEDTVRREAASGLRAIEDFLRQATS